MSWHRVLIWCGFAFACGCFAFCRREERGNWVWVLVVVAMVVVSSGCSSVRPDKLLIGVDHTSHILQHFKDEGWRDHTGCTGPMLALRWQGEHYYVQASDMYCAQGRNDLQHEVANVQAGYAVSLK